ncbi:MAG: NAD-glutamate dehydrogenase, partial [Thermoanaerobaculia bacterium]|nr:NAD-glutamate dehydrogenase [Thermoanaerobaculia bacterium]
AVLRTEAHHLGNGGIGTYVKASGESHAEVGDPTNVGVRIDAHRSPTQKAPERESHHLTQYLLVEYFHNKKPARQPFHVKWPYPGVVWDSSKQRVETFENPGGTPHVDLVGQNTGGRGLDMPAISLAAVTHRQGRLHVPPRKPDESGYSPAQVHAIHAEFSARMPAELVAANDKNDFARFKRYVEGTDPAKKEQKRKDAHREIYGAMQGTYRWMRDYMQGRLEDSMPQLELDYFEGTLERFGLKELSAAQAASFKESLEKVARVHAKARNQELMNNLGWPGVG